MEQLNEIDLTALRPFRGRGLRTLSRRLGRIAREIEFRLKERPVLRVLEVGFGFGTVLMELRQRFGDCLELHGISRTSAHGDWNAVRQNAIELGIFTAEEIDGVTPPTLHFGNVDKGIRYPTPPDKNRYPWTRKIPGLNWLGKKMSDKKNRRHPGRIYLQNDYFDFIFSQTTTIYFADKIRFLTDMNRILAPGGQARIDMIIDRPNLPREYSCALEIWNGPGKISFWDCIKDFPSLKRGKTDTHRYLQMEKAESLEFNLDLVSAINLNNICPDWHGQKSIYRVRQPGAPASL